MPGPHSSLLPLTSDVDVFQTDADAEHHPFPLGSVNRSWLQRGASLPRTPTGVLPTSSCALRATSSGLLPVERAARLPASIRIDRTQSDNLEYGIVQPQVRRLASARVPASSPREHLVQPLNQRSHLSTGSSSRERVSRDAQMPGSMQPHSCRVEMVERPPSVRQRPPRSSPGDIKAPTTCIDDNLSPASQCDYLGAVKPPMKNDAMLVSCNTQHEEFRNGCSSSDAAADAIVVEPHRSSKPNLGPDREPLAESALCEEVAREVATALFNESITARHCDKPPQLPKDASKPRQKGSSMFRFVRAGLQRARRWSRRKSTPDSNTPSEASTTDSVGVSIPDGDTSPIGELASPASLDVLPAERGTHDQEALPTTATACSKASEQHHIDAPCMESVVADEMPLPAARGLYSPETVQPLSERESLQSCRPLCEPWTPPTDQGKQNAFARSPEKTPDAKQTPLKSQAPADVGRASRSQSGASDFIIRTPREPVHHSAVALSVYSLKGASALNNVTELAGIGGAYHVGVEICCLEWSFGFTPVGTGVHNVYAGCSELGVFKERIPLGLTPCSPREIIETIGTLRVQWPGTSYDLLRRNCTHFSMELVRRLKVDGFPDWVNSLASLVLWLTEWVDGAPVESCQDKKRIKDAEAALDKSDGADSSIQAAVASELDWQEAQDYMLQRVADAIEARRRRNFQI